MKLKLVFYHYLTICIIGLCIILFGINCIISHNAKEKANSSNEFKEKNVIEYKADQTIRVKIHKTGEIIAMDINDYLRGVVPSEMPPSYNIEALKAQAVVARTYTYRKMISNAEGEDADICDDHTHCQAFYDKDTLFSIWRKRGFSEELIQEYWYKINEAVVSTQDQVITYNGELIKAFFHASSPYKTEDIKEIWGGESLPYLVSVENKENEEYQNRTSEVSVSFQAFICKIKEKYNIDISSEDCKNTEILDYTISGRVKNIKSGSVSVSAENLRTMFGLKSTDFTLEVNEDNIIFKVTGYGHGIGMSQVGADTYANEGLNYEKIIKHYYTGVELKTLTKK